MRVFTFFSIGFLASLSLTLIAAESGALRIQGSESFWAIRCREDRGIEHTQGSPLQRLANVDAFRSEIRSASFDSRDEGKVVIEGLAYGMHCQRATAEGPFRWKAASLRSNPGVRLLIRSGSPFPESLFAIQLRDDSSYRLELPASEFFSRRDLARLRAGEGFRGRTFSVQFQLQDNEGRVRMNLRHPFQEYSYDLPSGEAGGSPQFLFQKT